MSKTLAESHPALAAEWHPTKNGSLTPAQVSYGSNKKVWWLGKCGHEWQTSIYNRYQGKGCPYCAGRIVLPGYNDLATIRPEIAAEWHPTKNGSLTPAQVTPGSGKKVWWLGACGHEWQMVVKDRCSGRNCPYCSGKQVLPGYNDLATVRPEIAAEWHPTKNGSLTPAQVSYGSRKKVWWQCANGHEWQAVINNRVYGCDCPICSGKKVLPGYNDLATVRPELAAEWHPTKNGDLTPEQVTPGSNKKVWWRGKCGHEWQATIASRSSGCGCPECVKERQTSFPEQAIFFYLNQLTPAENRYLLNGKIEIDIYLPAYRIGIEYDGGAWHQDAKRDLEKNRLCEHAGVRLIRVREPGCPAIPVECIMLKSLATDELNKAIQTVCVILKKTVKVNIDRDRTNIYEQYIEIIKQNSLAVLNPELAAEWHPTKNGSLTPAQVMPSTQKKVWWRGKCGHEWQATIASRTAGLRCPICSGQKVLPGYNDLATVRPELAAEWHPTKNGDLTPEQVTPGSGKKVWWRGKCGHEWQAVIAGRNKGVGCPVCAETIRTKNRINAFVKKNGSLAMNNPALTREWHPTKNGSLTPEQVTKSSHKKVWWLGACGHEWQARIADRNRGRGCPVCAGKK